MATIQLQIVPLSIQSDVIATFNGQKITMKLGDLDEDTLGVLIDELVEGIMERAEKQRSELA